eukprot:TRINITY_DN1315_c0_g1_i2.p1 TRINITY_DN1315_c0_g1~~TRINITY_DN1315_c0_g1_i2.p1  ORF type:complete len:355 (-),score=38.68 TRINITY_DN1315_c0_g1_i2:69-1133(-)
MRNLTSFLTLFIFVTFSLAKLVTISNISPRLDSTGKIFPGSDGNIVQFDRNGLFYFYAIDYGSCQEQPQGCSNTATGSCGFRLDHNISLWTSEDLSSGSWKFQGNILPVDHRPVGVYYRPIVVYNPNTQMYVLWANLVPSSDFSQSGYVAAVSKTREGPFNVVNNNVATRYTHGGDFSILVDDNGTGYLIYTSLSENHVISIEQLTPDFLGSMAVNNPSYSSGLFPNVGCTEAPSLFKRNGVYFAAYGYCCCFCSQGSNLFVYSSNKPLGPYNYQGDIGAFSNGTSITHAQQNGVFKVETLSGVEYIWVGERWQSAPDKLKNHDFQFFTPLTFDGSGEKISQLKWIDSFTLNLP